MQTRTESRTNRISTRMADPAKVLSIYFTAGYPGLEDTVPTLEGLQASGVDLVEIGLPFSDPLADGPTIQASSTQALRNGMSTDTLFEQLEGIRGRIHIPLVLMGYFNPMFQYGVERFCARCADLGIDGLIMPDLPLAEYLGDYRAIYRDHGLYHIPLITPQTGPERIREIDAATEGFIYMVSSASTTGSQAGFGAEQLAYFNRIADMGLRNPTVVGFGIKDAETYAQATARSSGAIIGSAFIQHMTQHGVAGIPGFIEKIR